MVGVHSNILAEVGIDVVVEGSQGVMVEGVMVEGMLVEGVMVEGVMVEGMLVESVMVEGVMVEGVTAEGALVDEQDQQEMSWGAEGIAGKTAVGHTLVMNG